MALRVRVDGRILCAAMHPELAGDTYLDDSIHYYLSAERKVLVTECAEKHRLHGEWWWAGAVPISAIIDPFYVDKK